MYEAYFGLQRRPFAATPDANCWFHSERYQAALDELLVCAEQGQGIGIVLGNAGVGKTLLCERLVREIGEPFTSVLLRHATYQSRRGFLQTLLSELAQPYDKPTDQELRLALAPVLRGLGQQGRALLLVVDEAHQLSESLLEELRILADQAEDGRPLVRLILSGQFALEDKLAHPQLQALNQRVRAHVSVTSLTAAESADYLDYRITWSGGRTEELLTPQAVESICRAADGVPRCLNQLCDHALLLAYVADRKPVGVETVIEALEDLQHLPLAWRTGELANRDQLSTTAAAATTVESGSSPIAAEPINTTLEFGSSEPTSDDSISLIGEGHRDVSFVSTLKTATPSPEFVESCRVDSPDTLEDGGWREEIVLDRYTALDAGLQPPEIPPQELAVPVIEQSQPPSPELFERAATERLSASTTIDERLEAVQHVLEYVDDRHPVVVLPHAGDVPPLDWRGQPSRSTLNDQSDFEHDEFEVVSDPANDDELATAGRNLAPTEPMASVFEIGSAHQHVDVDKTYDSESRRQGRPLRNLFTLLRRKQQGRL